MNQIVNVDPRLCTLADLLQIPIKWDGADFRKVTGTISIAVPATPMTFTMEIIGGYCQERNQGAGVICHVKENLYLVAMCDEIGTQIHLIDGTKAQEFFGGGLLPKYARIILGPNDMYHKVMQHISEGIVKSFNLPTREVVWSKGY